MYTLIKTTTRFAVVALGLLLTACVTDVYEPDPNPEPTPTPIPGGGGFDFSTVEETTLIVNVDDQYNGEFDYQVEVYYVDPFDNKDAACKFKGITNVKKPLSLVMALPQALEQIYVMQIDPTTGRSVKTVSITAGATTLSCDFRPVKVPETMSTKSVLKVDGDAIELTGTGTILLDENTTYIISAGKTVRCESLTVAKTSILTINGTLSVSGNLSVNGGGDKIRGGELNVSGGGVITAQKITMGLESLLDNVGKITVTGTFTASELAQITNSCYMEMGTFDSHGAELILNKTTLFKCNNFQSDNGFAKMYDYAILRAQTATIKGEYGISGYGGKYAIVDFAKTQIEKNSALAYNWNIQVIIGEVGASDGGSCDYGNAKRVDMNAAVEIPAGDCTGEGNVVPDKPEPSNPNYPIEIPNGGDYTFAMEDNWPSLGDYDMNDLVLGMKITLKAGNGNGITRMEMQITLRAVGARKMLGAGLQFENVSSDMIKEVMNTQSVNGYFSPNGNGVESGNKAVLPLFDNAHFILRGDHQLIQTNTSNKDMPVRTLEYFVDFTSPVPQADLVITKLNFFIVNGGDSNQRSEVHLAGYAPTAKVKGDTKNYVSEDGMVWGIMIPTVFQYPKEGIRITDAYNGFAAWSQSGGKSNADWYNSPTESEVLPIYEGENVGK